MKKITGVLKAKGFDDCNFEFYVDDNMTEKQIEMEVYQRAGWVCFLKISVFPW